MNVIIIALFTVLTIVCFNKKREYVLATFLVGQPILKWMLKPFPQTTHTDIFLLLYILIGIISVIILHFSSQQKYKVPTEAVKTLLWCTLFVVLMGFTLHYSPSKAFGLSKLIEFVSVNIWIVLLCFMTIRDSNELHKVMGAIANIAMVIGLLTIVIVFIRTGDLVVRLGTSAARDIQILGINFPVSIWFGRRMGLGFLSILYLNKIHPCLLNRAKCGILLFLTMLSVSRGPIFSLVVTLVFLSLLQLREGKSGGQLLKYFIFFLFFILLVTLTLLGNMDQGIFGRLLSLNDGNALSRVYLYDMSLMIIKQNLFGIGLGGFNSFGGLYSYPHNIFLEIMLELGIMGMLYFLFILLKAFITFFQLRALKMDREKLMGLNFSLAVFVFALINAQFSGDLPSNEIIWFGVALLASCKQVFLGAVSKVQHI